jgi:hypothetical protein
MANLTREESVERRRLRRHLFAAGGVLATSECGRVTVTMVPDIRNGRIACMSTSIASPREKHLVTALGELHALRRLMDGVCCIVPWKQCRDEQWNQAQFLASMIAVGLRG